VRSVVRLFGTNSCLTSNDAYRDWKNSLEWAPQVRLIGNAETRVMQPGPQMDDPTDDEGGEVGNGEHNEVQEASDPMEEDGNAEPAE
jgi:hypothetical protein